MDPFTQKLLERTQARKDALTKKRQEWEQNAKNSSQPNDPAPRRPLEKKDLNNGKAEAPGIQQLKKSFEGKKDPPRMAGSRTKRPSPTKETTSVQEKKAKASVRPCESMIGTPRSGRTARQNKTKKSPVAETQTSSEVKQKRETRGGQQKHVKKPANVASESIQERLARLEEQKKRKAAEVVEHKRKRQNEIETHKMARERLYENAKTKDRYDVKRHSASLDEKLAMFEKGKDMQMDTHASMPKKSSRANCARKVAVESAEIVSEMEDEVEATDTEGYEAGMEEQTEDEDNLTEEALDEDNDIEENPFDISAILQEAEAADNIEIVPETEPTADQPASFSDMVAQKAQSIKTSLSAENLYPLDNDVTRQSPKKKQAPQKPVRSFDPLPAELIQQSNEVQQQKQRSGKTSFKKQISVDVNSMASCIPGQLLSPDDASPVKSKRRMRRSISFSEGQGKPLFKSGYNAEASKHYDASGNQSDDSIVELSTREKIQELLEEAASQQNIVLQTSQALNANEYEEKQGSPEVIEGHRLLLLATERKNACLEEVQMLKKQTGSVKRKECDTALPPCKSKLVVSGVKLPLNHDFLKALRSGRLDLGTFHFVVVVQYGPRKIYATAAVSSNDAVEASTIPLPSKIVISDVSHDFCLIVKVFGMHTKRVTEASLKGKKMNGRENTGLMKNVISSFTPRKKAGMDELQATNASPKTVFRTSNFMCVGQTKIDITMLRSEKHVLCKVPGNCPLDGFIQLRVDCLPQFTAHANGFLTIFQDVGGYTAWNRRWCTMQGNVISYWRYPDEESSKEPLGHIDLKWCQNSTVELVARDQCARPNTFEIIFRKPLSRDDKPGILSTVEGQHMVTKCWISTDTKDDRLIWLRTLNRQLSDYKAWSDLEKGNGKGINQFRTSNPHCRYNSPRNSPASVYV